MSKIIHFCQKSANIGKFHILFLLYNPLGTGSQYSGLPGVQGAEPPGVSHVGKGGVKWTQSERRDIELSNNTHFNSQLMLVWPKIGFKI